MKVEVQKAEEQIFNDFDENYHEYEYEGNWDDFEEDDNFFEDDTPQLTTGTQFKFLKDLIDILTKLNQINNKTPENQINADVTVTINFKTTLTTISGSI